MKHRRIKFFISICYWTLHCIKRIFLNALGREPEGRCTAVYFHSVKDGERENFRRQMNLLKKTAVPLNAGYTGRLEKGKNYVIVTFDDGFKSIIKNALPELERLNIPCAVFFPVKYLGGKPVWEFNTRFPDENEDIMTARDIKNLPRGFVSIGSHSYSHRLMTVLNSLEVKEEFIKSREYLESLSTSAIELFSFPYSVYNADLVQEAIESGYKRVFTGSYEVAKSEMNNAVLGRVRVDPMDSIFEFKLKILGAYEWMNRYRFMKEKFFSLIRKKDESDKTKTDYTVNSQAVKF